MHFILTAVGSAGDVNPLLWIAEELLERGHRIDFLASAHFRDKVKATGVNFIEFGSEEEYQQTLSDPDLWVAHRAFYAIWRTLKRTCQQEFELVSNLVSTQGSVLVGTTLAFGTRMVGESLKTPMATIHLSPSILLSSHDLPHIPGYPRLTSLPLFLRSGFMNFVDKGILDGVCKRDLNEIRAGFGLSPVSSIMRRWLHSPQKVICAFPDWLAEIQPDWPPNTVTTAFPLRRLRENEKPIPEDLQYFLNQGEPPVVFTAGSAMATSRQFFTTALEATNLIKRRALFLTQFPEQLPPHLPPHVATALYVPFESFLDRTAAIVHHGGIGTCAQALFAGCPQLITPFAHDQFDNAARLTERSVAETSFSHTKSTEWADKLRRLLSDQDVSNAVGELKTRMQAVDPLPLIAKEIESIKV